MHNRNAIKKFIRYCVIDRSLKEKSDMNSQIEGDGWLNNYSVFKY